MNKMASFPTIKRSVFMDVFDKALCKCRLEELNPEQKIITKNFIIDPARVKIKIDKKIIEDNRALLNQEFPNFRAVTNKIFDNLLLTTLSETKGINFQPLLMVGEPGIGKTYYTSRLTALLEVPKIAIDLSTATSGFVFTGTSSKWGNASVGNIAKLLMTQKVCNGIVILDELDKTKSGFSNGSDPLLALLSLLEQHSAKEFRDEFLEFSIDAAELNYIATANDISEIPNYILSRFDICQIKKLDDAQIKDIAKTTYTNLLTELEIEDTFSSELSQPSIDEICNVSDVRQLKKVITNAMVSAARDSRLCILKKDVVMSLEGFEPVEKAKLPIGFVH